MPCFKEEKRYMECLEPVGSVKDSPAPVLTSGRGAPVLPLPGGHVCYYVTGSVFPARLGFLRGEQGCFHPHSLASNTCPGTRRALPSDVQGCPIAR